jgi:hypothetical protein
MNGCDSVTDYPGQVCKDVNEQPGFRRQGVYEGKKKLRQNSCRTTRAVTNTLFFLYSPFPFCAGSESSAKVIEYSNQ